MPIINLPNFIYINLTPSQKLHLKILVALTLCNVIIVITVTVKFTISANFANCNFYFLKHFMCLTISNIYYLDFVIKLTFPSKAFQCSCHAFTVTFQILIKDFKNSYY